MSELRQHFAAIPTMMAELGEKELDAIMVAGRELARRERTHAFIVLAVLAAPVAAAGLLAGISL